MPWLVLGSGPALAGSVRTIIYKGTQYNQKIKKYSNLFHGIKL